MKGLRLAKTVMGLCVALAASSAWADGSPFVGRGHWSRAQSTIPSSRPVPNDVTAAISRADSALQKWSLTVLATQGQWSLGSHPVSIDTTAAFRVTGNTLQAKFKSPTGQTDNLTCTLAADR